VNPTLEQLELALLEIQRRIARQRELIAEFEQVSWDAAELLRHLQELEAQHVADRERLLKELGKASTRPPEILGELNLLSAMAR